MELVEATAEDLATVAEYWYRLASEMEPYSELNELSMDGPAEALDGVEANHLDDEDATPYLLVADGDDVGYLLLHDGEHPSRRLDSYVEIVDLYVTEEHRSEGYGSEVIQRVEAIARERGADYVKVGCEWNNEDARRFYEDTGFTEKHLTYVQRVD